MLHKISVWRPSTKRWETGLKDKKGDPWVSISDGYIYLSYKKGRSYWIFSNGAKAKLKFIDSKLQMNINTFRVRFERKADYLFAQRSLQPWA